MSQSVSMCVIVTRYGSAPADQLDLAVREDLVRLSGSGSASRELIAAGEVAAARRPLGAAAAPLVGDDEEAAQPDDAEHDQRAQPAQQQLHGALRFGGRAGRAGRPVLGVAATAVRWTRSASPPGAR